VIDDAALVGAKQGTLASVKRSRRESSAGMIVCRSRAEIEKLRRVNQLVAQVLAELRQMAARA